MRKFLTNVMSITLVAGLTFGATSCKGIGERIVVDVDTTKTQLYIASYSGGGGYKWLDDAIERFQEKYKDYSFEEGKVGAQIIPDHSKLYSTSKVPESLATGGFDVYFAPGDYYDFAERNYLMDITDIVTGINPNDNKTIESKMNDETQSRWKMNGKYYGLPYYYWIAGVSYDADLFKENRLYFSNQLDEGDLDYPGTNAFVTSKNPTNLSCGPDGVFGTYDDGLPSTYQEFYKLMARMASGDGGEVIIPFAFTGQYTHYTNIMINALEANMVGVNGMKTTVDFNSHGEAVDIVTGFNGDEPKYEGTVLTEGNAYLLKSSLGLYYACEFCDKVFTNRSYYDAKAASESSSNITVQEMFLKSGNDGSTPIAMLIEGSYWYNESISEGAMGRAIKYGEKNIKFMPLPHQYAGTVTPRAEPMGQVMITSSANAMIAADIPSERINLAKTFLQFCYSDDELVKAELSNNGIGRDLVYDTSSISDQLPTYAKSLNDISTQAIACGTIFSDMSLHPIARKNTAYWNRTQTGSYWKSSFNGSSYDSVVTAYKNGKATAKSYFEGLKLDSGVYNQMK